MAVVAVNGALVLAWCWSAAAPAAVALDFGGSFEVSTSPTFAAPLCPVCNNANGVTGACSCPPGAALPATAAVVNDCAAAAGIDSRPAWVGVCMPDALLPGARIGGMYQVSE